MLPKLNDWIKFQGKIDLELRDLEITEQVGVNMIRFIKLHDLENHFNITLKVMSSLRRDFGSTGSMRSDEIEMHDTSYEQQPNSRKRGIYIESTLLLKFKKIKSKMFDFKDRSKSFPMIFKLIQCTINSNLNTELNPHQYELCKLCRNLNEHEKYDSINNNDPSVIKSQIARSVRRRTDH